MMCSIYSYIYTNTTHDKKPLYILFSSVFIVSSLVCYHESCVGDHCLPKKNNDETEREVCTGSGNTPQHCQVRRDPLDVCVCVCVFFYM